MTSNAPLLKYPYPNTRWALFQFVDIESGRYRGHAYLRRLYLIKTPLFTLNIHWIFEDDTDKHPHNHPANFWSFILRGGYTEDIYPEGRSDTYMGIKSGSFTHKRFSRHKMPTYWAHQIVSLKSKTITLVFFGRRNKEWGFFTKEGFVPKNIYFKTHKYDKHQEAG